MSALQRLGAAARREEGEYRLWIFDRRTTPLQRKRSLTLRAKLWQASGGVAPQLQSAMAMILRYALPAARQSLAHSCPVYEMGSYQSMKSRCSVNHLAPCILAISLLWSTSAIATENFAGFHHIDASGEPPEATQAASDWGPVQTDKASIANLSPVLLPFFDNGPVFDCPGLLSVTFGKIRN